jgi:hypothetical protein
MTNIFLEHALKYAEQGIKIFPLKPKSKIPLTPNGFKDATDNIEQIKQWWIDHPEANIGIPTGMINGFFVYDIDGDYPEELPPLNAPYTVKTSRGYHVYFDYPEGVTIKSRNGIKGYKVDIKSDGGYIVAPPSIHPEGGCYEFIN